METYRILVIEGEPAIGQSLLDNALKFTPRQGSVSVELDDAGEAARLVISETGIGVPPQDLPHLSERFHRERNVSEYAGNGLGLSIVRAIVTRHAGDMRIESRPGQGTRVIVSLPIECAD